MSSFFKTKYFQKWMSDLNFLRFAICHVQKLNLFLIIRNSLYEILHTVRVTFGKSGVLRKLSVVDILALKSFLSLFLLLFLQSSRRISFFHFNALLLNIHRHIDSISILYP